MEYLDEFIKEYKELNNKEQEKFKEVVSKLINVNYLTGEKESDIEDYYFVTGHFKVIKNYLNIIDININQHIDNKVIVVNSKYLDTINLTKFQSSILLILRLLYYQKYTEINLTNKVIVTGLDIRDKYAQIGLREDDMSTTNLAKALGIFKKNNLINYKGNDFRDDDFQIIIYSTIQYAISVSDIQELVNILDTYKKNNISGGEVNEEVNEDKID